MSLCQNWRWQKWWEGRVQSGSHNCSAPWSNGNCRKQKRCRIVIQILKSRMLKSPISKHMAIKNDNRVDCTLSNILYIGISRPVPFNSRVNSRKNIYRVCVIYSVYAYNRHIQWLYILNLMTRKEFISVNRNHVNY